MCGVKRLGKGIGSQAVQWVLGVGRLEEEDAEEALLPLLSFLCVIAVGLFVSGTAAVFQVSAAFCLAHSIPMKILSDLFWGVIGD